MASRSRISTAGSSTSGCSPDTRADTTDDAAVRRALRPLLGLLGALLLAASLWPAGREAAAVASGAHSFIPLGQLWFEIDPPSLNMTQAGIQRHVAPWLWEDVIQPVLELPAWPALASLGAALLLLRPRHAR